MSSQNSPNHQATTKTEPASSDIVPEDLKEMIIWRLKMVIDPETGADVIRMRLIEDLYVDHQDKIHYKFRPSSPVCPIAVQLAVDIKRAVAEVQGVTGQSIEVVGYVQAEQLTAWLNEMEET